MQQFIDYARSFREHAARHAEKFGRLAAGQSPQALFITCSDSRVVPSVFTGAGPGELFELRTAGNIVPEYRPGQPSGEMATIEYAVEVLEVPEIIVCGHSHCGAVGAMVRGDDLAGVPAVRGWLENAASAVPGGLAHYSTHSTHSPHSPPVTPPVTPDVAQAVQHHVLHQLDRLRGYPPVAARLADGRIRLHGWFYEVHTGSVLAHQAHDDTFLPL